MIFFVDDGEVFCEDIGEVNRLKIELLLKVMQGESEWFK